MILGSHDTSSRVLVVAEIGNNHEGRFDVAQDLVRRAADCGVGAVKFQTFRAERFVSARDAERFAQLKSFELSQAQVEALAALARARGLLFMSTPLDLASAAWLLPLVDAYKIASGDMTFYPLLAQVAMTTRPLILSAGASDMAQIRRTIAFVREHWTECGVAGELALLHCVSSYPVPPEQANLLSIPYLAAELDVTIGYSDHVVGIEAAVLAAALGARIIEKHFTLDKTQAGFRDHQLSADPEDMRALVERVKTVTLLRGRFEKEVQPCETAGAVAFRRSVAAVADLPEGRRLEPADLTWLRPAGGVPPGDESRLIGRVLRRPLAAGDPIDPRDLI